MLGFSAVVGERSDLTTAVEMTCCSMTADGLGIFEVAASRTFPHRTSAYLLGVMVGLVCRPTSCAGKSYTASWARHAVWVA